MFCCVKLLHHSLGYLAMTGKNLTKKDIAGELRKRKNIPADAAKKFVDSALSGVSELLLKCGRFSIPNFCTFIKHQRKARSGSDINTGKRVEIPERNVVKCTPAKLLRSKVKE